MAKRDMFGHTVETPQEATQSENSKDSFKVLVISMILAFIVGVGLLWYFGVSPF